MNALRFSRPKLVMVSTAEREKEEIKILQDIKESIKKLRRNPRTRFLTIEPSNPQERTLWVKIAHDKFLESQCFVCDIATREGQESFHESCIELLREILFFRASNSRMGSIGIRDLKPLFNICNLLNLLEKLHH